MWHEILRLPTNWHEKFNHPFVQFSDPLPKINMSRKKGDDFKWKVVKYVVSSNHSFCSGHVIFPYSKASFIFWGGPVRNVAQDLLCTSDAKGSELVWMPNKIHGKSEGPPNTT